MFVDLLDNCLKCCLKTQISSSQILINQTHTFIYQDIFQNTPSIIFSKT
uniref:Uncharacterized protein n=1 Tax=Rhizophora mucronata TaxID=61149 RepID=A0A2P2QXJ8_RHIMU